jgi:hypothetical protein
MLPEQYSYTYLLLLIIFFSFTTDWSVCFGHVGVGGEEGGGGLTDGSLEN